VTEQEDVVSRNDAD